MREMRAPMKLAAPPPPAAAAGAGEAAAAGALAPCDEGAEVDAMWLE